MSSNINLNPTFSKLLENYELANSLNLQKLEKATGLYQEVLKDANPQPYKCDMIYQKLKNVGVTDRDIDECCDWAEKEINRRLSSDLNMTFTYYIEGLINALICKKSFEKEYPTYKVTFNPKAQVHETVNYRPNKDWYLFEQVAQNARISETT